MNTIVPTQLIEQGGMAAQWEWWFAGFLLAVSLSAMGSLIRLIRGIRRSSPEL